MRIASNKLSDLVGFFHSELKDVYSFNEIEALADTAVEFYLGFSKTERLLKHHENLNQSDVLKLYDCAKDLKKNIPLQYILGETWFYGLRFFVNASVLIPRPETEELVDLIIKQNKTATSFLDLCTGSGCIAVAIQCKTKTSVTAVELSKEAIGVAKKNSVHNQVSVTFIEQDVLNVPTVEDALNGVYDVIVSNPPYIELSEKETMGKNVLQHEPNMALFVEGNDPILFYKRIIDLCKTKLAPHGKLYFELNPLTAEMVKQYAEQSGLFNSAELIKDMSSHLRFFKAQKQK